MLYESFVFAVWVVSVWAQKEVKIFAVALKIKVEPKPAGFTYVPWSIAFAVDVRYVLHDYPQR